MHTRTYRNLSALFSPLEKLFFATMVIDAPWSSNTHHMGPSSRPTFGWLPNSSDVFRTDTPNEFPTSAFRFSQDSMPGNNNISAMPVNEAKSHEELRWKGYGSLPNNKCCCFKNFDTTCSPFKSFKPDNNLFGPPNNNTTSSTSSTFWPSPSPFSQNPTQTFQPVKPNNNPFAPTNDNVQSFISSAPFTFEPSKPNNNNLLFPPTTNNNKTPFPSTNPNSSQPSNAQPNPFSFLPSNEPTNTFNKSPFASLSITSQPDRSFHFRTDNFVQPSQGKVCEDKDFPTSFSFQLNIKEAEHSSAASNLHEDSILSLLPKLPEGDEYYTVPSLNVLAAKEMVQPGSLSRVEDFVVGRFGYGSIKFLGETDVRHLDLASVVRINMREVIVCAVGKGMNKAAEVTLLNVKCVSKKTGKQYVDGPQVQSYMEMLIKKGSELEAEFVSYDPVRGEWKFRVQQFYLPSVCL